jgi:hypothetical protein
MFAAALRIVVVLLLCVHPARAQTAIPMLEYHDPSGFSIDHPAAWNVTRSAASGKAVIGRHAGDHLLLCNVDEARRREPLEISQPQLDQQLARGFQSPQWPQQLAGSRTVLAYEVRGVGDVPMGTIEWEATKGEQGRAAFARGVMLVRLMRHATWTAECAVISETRFLTDAYFRANADLLGRILSSVRFPES